MRDLDTALLTYFEERRAIFENTLIWITARHPDTNVSVSFGFWDGEKTQTIGIYNRSGVLEYRDYIGGGVLKTSPTIESSTGMKSISSLAFELFDDEDAFVSDRVRFYNLRDARVEVHKLYRHEDTELVVGEADRVFVGKFSSLDRKVPAVQMNEDGTVSSDLPYFTLVLIPLSRAMKINTRVRSRAVGAERSGDTFYKFTNTSWLWRIYWGTVRKSHKNHVKKNKDKPTQTGDDLNPDYRP